MGVVITPQSEIDKYFESDALSQSVLKKLTGGIESYLSNQKEESELFYTEKGHFVIGSAVDTKLTGEIGEFEKQYYITKLEKKPSEVEMSIVNMVFSEVQCDDIKELSNYPGSVLAAIDHHEWQKNWKTETRINKIIDTCSDYFEDLKKGHGKQILTIAENKLIEDIVFSLKSNPRTAAFFDRNSFAKLAGVTVYYQLPIYFYYKGVYCKALLDMLVVVQDEAGNVMTAKPIDLKTMNGSTFRFLNNMKSFRYDIQAAWYTEALLSEDSNFVLKGKITKENLKPFTFVVESNSFPGQPLVFEIDEEIMKIGKYGKKDLLVNVPGYEYKELVKQGYKGFDELLDTYKYQEENDWKEEEIITRNNGVLKIGWNGIKE